MYGTLGVLMFAFLTLPYPSCSNSDKLALLSSTMKTMQRAACEDEMVSLSCPRNTLINIQVARYGRAAAGSHDCKAETLSSSPLDAEMMGPKCLSPNTMQYSLLQTVVEACQKKPQCRFSTTPKPGLKDPCPEAKKFVEVAYKCRPNIFRSRTGCEGEAVQLVCNAHSRIAILNAQFGRIANEFITCPQPTGVGNETCMAPAAVETVMQICHGKRRCEVTAAERTFGAPCNKSSRPYLKVTYACVPLGVLIEKYESAAEDDEISDFSSEKKENDDDYGSNADDLYSKMDEGNVLLPVANPALQSLAKGDSKLKSINENLSMGTKKKSDIENETQKSSNKFLIYIGVGLLVFIILTTLLIGVCFYIHHKTSQKSKAEDMFSVETPNIFNDEVSDIDNDIDVSHLSGSFYDPTHPDMILYRDVPGSRGTLRAMRPLSTIYPCAGTSMYGNVDYVPSQNREVTNSLFRKDKDPEIALSPRSLSHYSTSKFYDG